MLSAITYNINVQFLSLIQTLTLFAKQLTFEDTKNNLQRNKAIPTTLTTNDYSVQLLSRVRLFATPWTAAHQASLSITNSQSSLKLMSIESVMPSSHLILGCPLLLLPPIPPSIRVFSKQSVLRVRWPKYWSFSFCISPSSEYSGLISLILTGLISLQSKKVQFLQSRLPLSTLYLFIYINIKYSSHKI